MSHEDSTLKRKSIDSLVPGVASGLAGLLTFLVLHHLWIVPTWFILPIGVVVAALGGVAVHRSYDALRVSLPAGPWAAPAMFGVVTVILLPSLVLAETAGAGRLDALELGWICQPACRRRKVDSPGKQTGTR